MLTEREVRDLLRLAGDTVDVGPAATPLPARRRAWPVMAATVAVAAVLGLVFALTGLPGGERDAVDPGPVGPRDPASVLDDDQVPSVFGLTGAGARALLEDRGWRVAVQLDHTCEVAPGRATGTDPATGARLRPGAQVTLTVTQVPPATRCVSHDHEAWQLIDLAHGEENWPRLGEDVTLYVDGEERAHLTGDRRFEHQAWEPVLTELHDAARTVEPRNGSYATPHLALSRITPQRAQCGDAVLAPALVDREALRMVIDIPTDGIFGCPTTVDLYTRGSRIVAVSAYTEKPLDGDAAEPAAGGAPAPELRRAAELFQMWVSGDYPFSGISPFADGEVELLLGNQHVGTTQLGDGWQFPCAGYAERRCPISLPDILLDGRPTVVGSSWHGVCLQEARTEPPKRFEDSERFAHIVVIRPRADTNRACTDDYAVQLWTDEQFGITAVNLFLGSP